MLYFYKFNIDLLMILILEKLLY